LSHPAQNPALKLSPPPVLFKGTSHFGPSIQKESIAELKAQPCKGWTNTPKSSNFTYKSLLRRVISYS